MVELSSFQTGEAAELELGIITSLYEEHLDWHGSYERYIADKLKLADVSRTLLVNGLQPNLMDRTCAHSRRHLFGTACGWHVHQGMIWRGAQRVLAIASLRVPGMHNAMNACAALTALEILGMDAIQAAPALLDFHPLPHRLQNLGRHAGLEWVNDSISTTCQATLAALG